MDTPLLKSSQGVCMRKRMKMDGHRSCCDCRPTTLCWALMTLGLLLVRHISVYGIDDDTYRSGRKLQKQVHNNIFIRAPDDFIKNDAVSSTSLPYAQQATAVFAESYKGGMMNGVKCKNKNGKKEKSDKYKSDDYEDDTTCAPTISTTTAMPLPVVPPTTMTTMSPIIAPPVPSPPPVPVGILPTKLPSGMGMSKNSPTEPPQLHPSDMGMSKKSPTTPPQPQIPVYIRCNESNGPVTAAPIFNAPTPVIPTLAPFLTASPVVPPTVVTTSAPITTTTAPLTPPSIITPAPSTFTPIMLSLIPSVYSSSSPPIFSLLPSLSSPSSFPGPGSTPPTVGTSAPIAAPIVAPVPVSTTRFDITLDFDEATVPTLDQLDVVAAAQRWEQVIVGDVADVPLQDLAGFAPDVPGCQYPTDTGFVDDLYVCVYYQPLDGNVIGQGGYIYTRDNGIPISGFIRVDPDEVEPARLSGYFNALLLHELGHALGIGTTAACPSNSISSMANIEYQRISQCSTIIPTDTTCGHYSEECLATELMTPVVSRTGNPLSRVTVGWANDIGYEVNYDAADPFDSSQLGTVAGCNCNRRLVSTTSNHSHVRYLGHHTSLIRSQETTSQHRGTQQIPELSAEGYKTALESGLTYLYKRIVQQGNLIRNDTSPDSNAVYVGDQFVWVYMRENDHVFSVLVRP